MKTTVQRNTTHNGVEILFAEKPAREIIDRLKEAGFRFHFQKKLWFKKFGAYAWAQAHTIAGLPLPGERDPGATGWYHDQPHQTIEQICATAEKRAAAGEEPHSVSDDLIDGYTFGHGSANAAAIKSAVSRGLANIPDQYPATIPVEQSQGVDRFDCRVEDQMAEACGLTNEVEHAF